MPSNRTLHNEIARAKRAKRVQRATGQTYTEDQWGQGDKLSCEITAGERATRILAKRARNRRRDAKKKRKADGHR